MNELTRRRVVSAATNRRLFFLKKKRKFEIFVVSTFPLLEAHGPVDWLWKNCHYHAVAICRRFENRSVYVSLTGDLVTR